MFRPGWRSCRLASFRHRPGGRHPAEHRRAAAGREMPSAQRLDTIWLSPTTGRRLPGKRQRCGADDVGRPLALELLGAADDTEIDAEGIRGEKREAGLEIGDQRLLGDAAAGAEGIAVEEDVLPDDAALRPGEEVIAEIAVHIFAVEIIGARERRPDADRAVIRLQTVTDAQQPAGLAIGEDVTHCRPRLGDDVDAIGAAVEQPYAPFALVG